MSFLNLEGKTFLIFGLASRKSVAYFTGKLLKEQGANVIYSVHTEKRLETVQKLVPEDPTYICDVEYDDQIDQLSQTISKKHPKLDGIVHSIAFANYKEGVSSFYKTKKEDYLQAVHISAYSLIEIAGCFKEHLNPNASVVSIGISSTYLTAENYGYMSTIKASLPGIIRYLAKSFSHDTSIRFNLIGAGPLKTNSSAGIPGYMDNYLYAEKLTFRKQALKTDEVANTVAFLLSERSSGMNGAEITIDAGLGMNYFDQEIVQAAVRPPQHKPNS